MARARNLHAMTGEFNGAAKTVADRRFAGAARPTFYCAATRAPDVDVRNPEPLANARGSAAISIAQ